MKARIVRRLSAALLLTVLVGTGLPGSADASHSWNGYHWARRANPFTLQLGNNVSAVWEPYLAATSSDWSASAVLDTMIVGGSAGSRVCRPRAGRVEVCSYRYGQNGWLGLAQVWVSGSHIIQGAVKMNDTYFRLARYNTRALRNQVMCQEVGHTLGLDHQDESGASLGTCMDYSNDPTPSQHPNQHDYEQLGTIYSHLDGTTTVGGAAPSATSGELERPSQWGKPIRHRADGRPGLFVRDYGRGGKVFTFVVWADSGQR